MANSTKNKKVVVIGGSGHSGSVAVIGAISTGADVTILSPHAKPVNTQANAVIGSITNIRRLAPVLVDADVVVISVESDWTSKGARAVYVDGMQNVIDLTSKDIHIIFIGNVGQSEKGRMESYNLAKLEAESSLKASGKNYTIIRPSAIASEFTGAKLEQGDNYTGRRDDVSRDQLATAIAAIIEDDELANGKTFELYGSSADIGDWSAALAGLVKDRP